jgi:hypothetical protein
MAGHGPLGGLVFGFDTAVSETRVTAPSLS